MRHDIERGSGEDPDERELRREELESDEPVFIEIPKLFHSAYLERPFEKCIDCGRELLSDESTYLISKSFVRSEAVFEMALCLDCLREMQARYSTETKQRVQAYLEEHAAHRPPRFSTTDDSNSPLTWQQALADCRLCGQPKSSLQRFEISGVCLGDQLVLTRNLDHSLPIPFLICDGCQSLLSELMSKQTSDMWNRFVEEHFPGPPGIEIDSPQWQPMLV